MTEEIKKVMKTYVGDDPYKGSFTVNGYLRDPNVSPDIAVHAKHMIKHVDAAFHHYGNTLDHDAEYYRGSHEGGYSSHEHHEPGYLSVSKKRHIAEEFADQQGGKIYKVKVPKGTRVVETDPYIDTKSARLEHGVLLPRGGKLKIQGDTIHYQRELADHERAHSGVPGSRVDHGKI